MQKLLLIILLLISANTLTAQYTYKGRVFKELTGEAMTFGDVRVPTGALRESRRGTKVAELDKFGYFSITLKDSVNVRIIIDCSMEGITAKVVSYADTLINLSIHTQCDNFNIDRAKRDIEEKKILLLYNGRIADSPNDFDRTFEKKFGIKYIIFTDSPEWSDCIRLYNGEIARYLDKRFGKEWRKDVRHDIQFF